VWNAAATGCHATELSVSHAVLEDREGERLGLQREHVSLVDFRQGMAVPHANPAANAPRLGTSLDVGV